MEGAQQALGLVVRQRGQVDHLVRGGSYGVQVPGGADENQRRRGQVSSQFPEDGEARGVGPLEVVLEDDDGSVPGEQREGGVGHGRGVRRGAVAQAQRGFQGVPLAARQIGGDGEQGPEHLVQGGVRQFRLRRRAGHPQHPQPGGEGGRPGLLQQRGPSRAGGAAQQQGGSGAGDVRQGRADPRELLVASRKHDSVAPALRPW